MVDSVGMTDLPIVWMKLSVLYRPQILSYGRDTEDHRKLDSNNAMLMHDDELSVVTGNEMINYDENNIEGCDTVTEF